MEWFRKEAELAEAVANARSFCAIRKSCAIDGNSAQDRRRYPSGARQGVPRLTRMLDEREGVTATFFIAMGPDNSGRAILRVFKNPGFLTKMRRTRAVSMYGLRTVLSGTLLPARPIALAFPQRDARARARGLRGRRAWIRSRALAGPSRRDRRAGDPREIDEAFEAFAR